MGTEGRRRIEPWPIAIVILLASMIGASLAFLRTSILHPDAVIAEDAFRASAQYDADLRRQLRAEAKGWSVDARLTPTAEGVRVEARLQDAQGATLAADRVTAWSERPSEGGLDAAERELAPSDAGTSHAGELALPRPGRWVLWIRAEREGETLLERVPYWKGGA